MRNFWCFATIVIILIVSPKALALSPSEQEKLQVLLLRAKQYRSVLEIDKQLVALNEALQIDPKNTDILDLRAKAYRDITRYDKAVEDYTTAIKISPKINFFRDRANCYFMVKNGAASIADYTKALSMNMSDAAVWRSRGRTYMRMNKDTEAIRDFEKCLSLIPPHTDRLEHETMNVLGKLYLKTHQFEKAITLFTKLIRNFPDLGKGYYGRAEAYKNLGKLDLAKADEAKGREMDYLLDPGLKPRK
ncbi:MAG: tetratricopeptide repeat protein [Leptolyngbya sp.]|nr:tetratricopeptide repeat protein [Candidatus Melainabacteria bacterium]